MTSEQAHWLCNGDGRLRIKTSEKKKTRKLAKKKKFMWPELFLSVPNTKTNGRLGFLKIDDQPDFPK